MLVKKYGHNYPLVITNNILFNLRMNEKIPEMSAGILHHFRKSYLIYINTIFEIM